MGITASTTEHVRLEMSKEDAMALNMICEKIVTLNEKKGNLFSVDEYACADRISEALNTLDE